MGARIAFGAGSREALLEVETHEIGRLVLTGEIIGQRGADDPQRIARGRAADQRAVRFQ